MKRVFACGGALLFALLAPAVATFGQNEGAARLLPADHPPYSLKLKDLSANWLSLRVSAVNAPKSAPDNALSQLASLGTLSDSGNKNKSDAAGAMLGMSLLSGMFGSGTGTPESGEPPVYYTQGQTVNLAGETFLVAYRHEKPGFNLMQFALEAAKSGGDKEPDFAKMAAENKLTAESSLSLSLINVKMIAALSGFRPFDMNQEIAESAKGAGGLLQLIADETAKEKQAVKPISPMPISPKPAPRKPAAAPRKR